MLSKTFAAVGLAAAFLAPPALASVPAPPHDPGSGIAESGARWWSNFADPALASLIDQGLAANHDIAQALARLDQARAIESGTRAQAGPAGGVRLQATTARAGAQAQLGVDLSWEIDLFGRLRAQSTAAAERVDGGAAQLEGVRLATSAAIAHAYFAALGARDQLALARAVAANREATVRLVGTRARNGYAAPIDEARAHADLEAARADLPRWEAAAQVATHRLAVLVGASPTGFALPVGAGMRSAAVALAIPPAATWLARRPDIRAHEADLRARKLDVEAIRAEFYPQFTVGGLLGFIAGSASAIGSGGSLSWLAGPSLLAPWFDRPRIEARLAAARAGEREMLAAYRQRILLAVEEVENAVTRYAAGQRQLENLERRARYAADAERLARLRFEAGAADMLELLEAQRTAQQASAGLAEALTAQRLGVVDVLRAVAGGLTLPSGQG